MRVYVWKERFAIAKARRPIDGFAVIKDRNEITVILEESKLDHEDIIEANKGWRILTFDAVLPFGLVGFLAKISTALAEEGISIFVISSYSTDHILIKDEHLSKAIKKLESLGFEVSFER